MTLAKGDRIQSGPGHRHTMVAGPVTGTVVFVRPGGLVEVEWDAVTFEGRTKQLPGGVEVPEDLELIEAAPARPGRTVAETRDSYEARVEAREQRLHQDRVTGARRDLRRWATVYRQRDELIHAAHAAGIGVNEIARITGLGKTTVIRTLRKAGEL